MIDPQQIQDALDIAIQYSSADQLEVLTSATSSALTRFSNNTIHQNAAETNVSLSVRAIVDKRTGYASTNRLDEAAIKDIVDKAVSIASHRPPDLEFVSLPRPEPFIPRDLVSMTTIDFTPADRAAVVKALIDEVAAEGLNAAGAFSTGYSTVGVANTLGANAIGTISEADFRTVVMSPTGSSYANVIAVNANDIPIGEVAHHAKVKAMAASNPVDLKPGKYTVILEPEAVADMVSFLAFAGFGALSLQEGRSFMKDRFGQQLVSPLISIWDDAFDPHTIGLTFDFEGVPKQEVKFIENGVARAVCYDSYTAQKAGKQSTGHALPAPNSYGPLPLNLIVGNGSTPVVDMMKEAEQAILVSRFHYTNLEDPISTILTGMTRDGTFIIENGTVKVAVKNMRFTQSILEALSNVVAVSSEREYKNGMLGGLYAPWLKIEGFQFTGATQF